MSKRKKYKYRGGYDGYYAGDDYGYGSYDFDWNRNLSYDDPALEKLDEFEQATGVKINQKVKDSFKGNWWDKEWSNYEKTGVWKGYSYYQKPTLDYRYVEQMANAFAGRYNIKVKVSNSWAIDLDKKELFYNPATLIYGTKGQVIALLLHEIGHLRHTTAYDKLSSPTMKEYPSQCRELVNVFEDLRIDKIMAQSYSGAEDVYACNKPIIEKMAKEYSEKGASELRRAVVEVKSMAERILRNSDIVHLNTYFGVATKEEAQVKVDKAIEELEKRIADKDTFFDYCSNILLKGYGGDGHPTGKLKERIEKTEKILPLCVDVKDTQAVLNLIEKHVVPHIRDLLKKDKDKDEDLEKALKQLFAGALGKDAIQAIMNELKAQKDYEQHRDAQQNKKGSLKLRASQSREGGNNYVPKEWLEGDYGSIKDSVMSSVKELVNKLRFLKSEDSKTRLEGRHLNGRLNVPRAYRYRMGDMRLFQRKVEKVDTVQSFTFSILMDISGSMSGNPAVHSTRGAVMLSEVCEEMGVPYEIMSFDTHTRELKKFGDKKDSLAEKRIGGLARANVGGTDLIPALETLEKNLEHRPERNKIGIILSDGCIGRRDEAKVKIEKLARKNIKLIGIGINCGDEIKNVCLGSGEAIDNPSELPDVFTRIMQSLILTKKKG